MLPHQLARPASAVGPEDARGGTSGFAVALVLALALTLAGCLVVCALVLSVVHPADATFAQSQGAKTLLYVVCFAGVLPVSLLAAVRLEPALVRRVGGPAARGLAALAALTVLLVPLSVRTLSGLGGPGGVHTVLAAGLLWWAAAAAVAVLIRRGSGAALLARLAGAAPAIELLAAVALLGVLLTLTDLPGIDPVALVVALAASAAVLAAVGRVSLPRLPRPGGVALDAVLVLVLLLAVPNVVVFTAGGIPSIYFPPGIIQFHQDFLLGPANQLLGGGALLVNVPVSQYGVGFIDFLYGWFHIAPIGYGTYGLLDGIVTALFYVVGYGILRVAGVARALAAAAIALSVVAFVLHLYYVVGALPQQGPLRFGLPIVIVFAAVAAERWPHRAGLARALALASLAVAGVWSAEMLVYTLFVYVALAVWEAWIAGSGRLRLIVRRVAVGIGAVLAGQVVMALWTLAATGSLPDYGGYLAYVDAFVLGHSGEGHVSYGFSSWSPAFAVGLGCLASVAGIVVLALRRPDLARSQRLRLTALAGSTAYAVALYSYTDNRSATYFLPYVALPLLLAGALWISLALAGRGGDSPHRRRVVLAPGLIVASLMLAAAWPTVSERFSQSALAHVLPGHGLRRALHRLWHAPPIDPRSPEGVRLLARFEPGHGALVVMPDLPDLGTEILIRSRRPNRLYIGDPKADAAIDPSQWTGRLRRQLAALPPGTRILTDLAGLVVAPRLRGLPESVPLHHPLESAQGASELEWVLQRLAERFDLVPIAHTGSGLVVAELRPRR